MKTVFLWIFVASFNTTHPNYQVWVDATGNPSVVASDTVATDAACQRLLDGIDAMPAVQQGHVTIYANRCIEITFPTKPETNI